MAEIINSHYSSIKPYTVYECCFVNICGAQEQTLAVLSFNHGIMCQVQLASRRVAPFQSSGHRVPELKISIGHFRREAEQEVRFLLILKATADVHPTLSVIVYFRFRFRAPVSANLHNLALAATPPGCLQEPVGVLVRSYVTFVWVQKHLAGRPDVVQDLPAALPVILVIKYLHHFDDRLIALAIYRRTFSCLLCIKSQISFLS